MRSSLALGVLVVSAGCGAGQDREHVLTKVPRPTSEIPITISSGDLHVVPLPGATASFYAEPTVAVRFENPGGMWMPHQILKHQEKLKSLGLELDPHLLAEPTSSVLGAVVSLGGCSASFVSADGLIVTNHHCATGALQYNSTATTNLLRDGYLARTHEEEKSNGPTARVFVTKSVTDVTHRVLAGSEAIKDDVRRYKVVERRQKELTESCEKGKTGIRCTIARFNDGAQFFEIEQLEIRDVRLVLAPPASVGNYGGEIDNWRWPRHTGDFTFFRAYVGKDGVPADYSKDNVPFKPAHTLKLASSALKEGDLVFVAGYPGRTNLYKSSEELRDAIEWFYPRRIKQFESYIKVIEDVGGKDPDAKIKGASLWRGMANYLTNTKGQLEGLARTGLLEKRAASDRKYESFSRTRADTGVEERLEKEALQAKKAVNDFVIAMRPHREKDAALRELSSMPRLLSAATTIVRMAEERAKADKDRHPDYQARNWKRLEQGLVAIDKSYNKALDEALMAHALGRMLATESHDRSEALLLAVGKNVDDVKIHEIVKHAFGETQLGESAKRVELFLKATTADLRKSKDPLIGIALKLRPLLAAAEDREDKVSGRFALLKPKYLEALGGSSLPPDANSTLRITYGTVRGYKASADKPLYRPFTLLSQVVAKATGKEPFDAPQGLIDAYLARKTGPYVDNAFGEVPVNFLSDLHITGGNSGSATLNAKGELAGLVFDGNYEAMSSDWQFQPQITRSIHVDLRYVLWTLDAVLGARELLTELGVKPAFAH